MATLNALLSANTYGNTGISTPFTDVKNIIGAIIVPKGTTLPSATIATALQTLLTNTNPLLRGYPVFDFESTKDGSEAKTIQTMSTGAKHVVKEGYNDHQFQFVNGGKDLQSNLRKFNGANWDFFYIDGGDLGVPNSQKLIGIAAATAGYIQAIPTDGGFIWADNFVLNDATKIAEYMVQFVFKQKYLNDLMAFIQLPFDAPTTLFGLEDIYLTGVADATSGSYDITLLSKTNTNIGALYSTALAAAGNFVATNTATGGTIAISGVTFNATGGYFVVALTKTDPNYPSTGTVSINLAAPSTLIAAGVVGCESKGAVAIAKN
jgi:hypothetical protein